MKRRPTRAFSLTEVIVSMALVVMISAIGYLACLVAIRIGGDGEKEARGYSDAEKFHLCLTAAYRDIGGDSTQKDEYVRSLLEKAEWCFGAEGIAERCAARGVYTDEWTEEVPIARDGTDSGAVFGVYYYGMQNGLASYSFRLYMADNGHETLCYVNCRTTEFNATVEARKQGANLNFYERTYRYGGAR